MEIKAGETIKVQTKTYGEVKIWNHADKALHFEWTKSNGRKDNGFFLIENGEVVSVSNVPQNLIRELPL